MYSTPDIGGWATPDRLIRVNGEMVLVEIKNWYQTRRQNCLADLPYLNRELKVKRAHKYFFQIQTAMLVTETTTCYFVVHGAQSQYEIVQFCSTTCNTILEKTSNFYNSHLCEDKLKEHLSERDQMLTCKTTTTIKTNVAVLL